MTIRLQFVLGRGIASQGIAWFSQGHFSHVDAVLPDGRLLGARSDTILRIPPGVRVRPANYEKWIKRTVFTLPCNTIQEASFYGYLMSQIGKPYDSRAIWAFVFDRNWRETDAWICSELQSAAMESAGIVNHLYLAANKITPVACALVASAISSSKYTDFPCSA